MADKPNTGRPGATPRGRAGNAPGKGTGQHTGGTRPENKTESARERPPGGKPEEGKK